LKEILIVHCFISLLFKTLTHAHTHTHTYTHTYTRTQTHKDTNTHTQKSTMLKRAMIGWNSVIKCEKNFWTQYKKFRLRIYC